MAWTLLKNVTASNASSADFTSDLGSKKLYCFKWTGVNPATDAAHWTFNGSVDAGSNYNVTKTTSFFRASHFEGGGYANVAYQTDFDLAQSTDAQPISYWVGNGADESASGELFLFNPASTTYVKHFYSTSHWYMNNNEAITGYMGGYFNNTADIDAVQFKMSSGNFDGIVQMWGL